MSVKLQTITELEDKCVDIRSNLLNFIYRIGMGHLGGELSIVEMTVALYYKYLNYILPIFWEYVDGLHTSDLLEVCRARKPCIRSSPIRAPIRRTTW